MKKLSVVIPVFNGEESLPHLFAAMRNVQVQLETRQVSMELIFVDDGSRDHSLQELLGFKENFSAVKVIKLTKNFGAVAASNTGLKFVTGDCFTIYAADLQDPPELIPVMVDKWLQGTKYIICQRSDQRQDPFMTKLFAKVYYKLIRFFVVSDFPETGFDIAFWDKSLLPFLAGTSKNINRSMFSHWLGFKPEVITYDRPKRMHGKSGWTLSKRIKLFIDSFLGFSVLPIRLISVIGMIVAFCSFGYGMLILIGALMGKAAGQGFPSIVTLISFLLGLIIIMLGVIGEYIWRIFDEVNKRPESVIDTVY